LLLELPEGEAAEGSFDRDNQGITTGGTAPDHRPAAGAAGDKPRPEKGDISAVAKTLLEKYLRPERT
jgi:hypothetical protein